MTDLIGHFYFTNFYYLYTLKKLHIQTDIKLDEKNRINKPTVSYNVYA